MLHTAEITAEEKRENKNVAVQSICDRTGSRKVKRALYLNVEKKQNQAEMALDLTYIEVLNLQG
jgi:hypothetical protein